MAPTNRRSSGGERRVLDTSVFRGDERWNVLKIGMAEFVGTGLMVFLGCMGGVVGLGENPSHLQASLAFGLTVGTIISVIGHISAAHLNPAVSVCAVILGKISLPLSVIYMVAQFVGAILGYGLLELVTPRKIMNANAPNGSCCALCVTLPHADVSAVQAMLAEAIVTGILILVVCAVWDTRNAHNSDSVPLKFSFTITAIAIAEGPYTGASMNPARSFGPAVWTQVWTSHWVYWVGPMLGSVVATYLYKIVWGVAHPCPEEPGAEEVLPLKDVYNSRKEAEARASETNLSSA